MSTQDQILAALRAMAHSRVHNYVVPGLTSSLIGGQSPAGTVRLFSSSRDTREWVTPHSHRYDFTTLVLKGEAENILFERSCGPASSLYAFGTLSGGLGKYNIDRGTLPYPFIEKVAVYRAGEAYSMKAEEIHSIRFSKGAEVLIFEGPERSTETLFLEPYVNGKTVHTFTTQPWMFEKE